MKWLKSDVACALLGIKPASLYAYVSRGLVRARTGESDPRASLYSASDIDQLIARKRAGRKRDSIARGSIGWGEPILESAIATVQDGILVFRGLDAVALSADQTLEQVASLLWGEGGLPVTPHCDAMVTEPTSKAAGIHYLASMSVRDRPLAGRLQQDLACEASALLEGLSHAMALGTKGSGAHNKLANYWMLNDEQGDCVRQALVLLADHELNPSTFAARIAASTGASLAACALAGFTTLTGPFHGEAASGAMAFLTLAQTLGPKEAVAITRVTEASLPGLGHRLYPDGDPRARALLSTLKPSPLISDTIELAEEAWAAPANIDMALAALTLQFDLPRDAPFTLFAVSRMAGWLAHGAEQGLLGALIRPRARYVGRNYKS